MRVGLPLNAATSFLLALVMRALDTVPIDRRDGAAARRQLAKLAAAVGDLLPPGGRLALRPGRVTVELLAPIPTTGLGRAGCESLRDQTEEAVTSALKNGPPLSVKRAG